MAKIYIPPDSRDLDDRALERFRNEIAITSKIRHPYIVRSLDSATVEIGTYKLPFYIMPLAAATLRSEVRADTDPDAIEKKFRLFVRAAQGVAFLHHNGIVHRDLKPENILIDRNGNPLVADLGIAHVNPDFVSVGLRTVASERLLNRDYYAPEQRFGAATTIDHRADIYALGCILYELLTSIPPVRVNTPALEASFSAFAPLDPIWRRMTDWDPERRYQLVEDALEDAWIALGLVLATMRGAAGLRHPDLQTMTTLLRSNNEMQRRRGIELAMRLGKAAMPELHSMLGHGRRDVRNSAATALGQIGDADSIPFLVAGLYSNAEKASHFRPVVDTAAEAIALHPADQRLRAVRMISRAVRPAQLLTMLKGVAQDEAYKSVLQVKEAGRLLLDWGESDLAILAALDEERAWPDIRALVENRDDFKLRHVIPMLSSERRTEVVKQWVGQGAEYGWHFKEQIRLVVELPCDRPEKLGLLDTIESKIRAYPRKLDEREQLLASLQRVRKASRL